MARMPCCKLRHLKLWFTYGLFSIACKLQNYMCWFNTDSTKRQRHKSAINVNLYYIRYWNAGAQHASLHFVGYLPFHRSYQCLRAYVLPSVHLLPVIAVSFASNGDVKLHLVVLVVRLRLSQVPLDAGPTQHHSAGGGESSEKYQCVHNLIQIG